MKEALEQIRSAALSCLADGGDEAAIEAVRLRYLGRKGELTTVMRHMRELSAEERPAMGALVNQIKDEIAARIDDALGAARARARAARAAERIDVTEPGRRPPLGRLHPLMQTMDEVVDVFRDLGFSVAEGPEIEDDYHNFEALNFPPDHPARDMQDTFWMKDGRLLRTHTSPVQVRGLQKLGPPLKMIAPGRVFRNEEVDASHEHTFYQVEGMMVDRDVSVAHMVYFMKTMLTAIFHREVTVRLRPGFFPFVEPGFELDIRCLICGGDGCSVCKQSGWVELMPCGLVHPAVLRSGGADPEKWNGFAFGLGLTRLAMMRYGIDDIRLMMGGDLRFLRQF